MRCPFCHTENRDERDVCYHCQKDLAMLRLIVNKARAHFNNALELAERDRVEDAITELHNALELDNTHVSSHVVLGTLYAKTGNLTKAEECWNRALSVDPQIQRAHEYIQKSKSSIQSLPICKSQRRALFLLWFALVLVSTVFIITNVKNRPVNDSLTRAWQAFKTHQYAQAAEYAQKAEKTGNPNLAGLGGLMLEMLTEEQNLLLRQAQQALRTGDLREAHDTLYTLIRNKPSEETRNTALDLLGRTRDQAQKNVSETLTKYGFRAARAEDVNSAADTYRYVSEMSTDAQFLSRVQSELTSITRTLKLEDAVSAYQRKQIGQWELLDKLRDLQTQYPSWGTPGKMQSDIANALEMDFRNGLDKKELEKAIDIGERLLKQTALSSETRQRVEPLLMRAENQLARDRWNWMMERDWKYIAAKITLQEADTTLRYYPQVSAFLNFKANPKAKEFLPLFAAASCIQQAQNEKAQALIEEAEKAKPGAEAQRWIKTLKKRIAPPEEGK